MPQSIMIAAFVFGAVLLLIALVGGGFSIFGAEVKEQVGPVRRTIAGVAGALLLLLAFAQNAPEPAPSALTAAATPSAPAATEAKPVARTETARPVPAATAAARPAPAATAAARSAEPFAGTYRLISYKFSNGAPGPTDGSMRIVAVGDGSYSAQVGFNDASAQSFDLRRSGQEWLLVMTTQTDAGPRDVYEVSVTREGEVLTISSIFARATWRRL